MGRPVYSAAPGRLQLIEGLARPADGVGTWDVYARWVGEALARRG